MGKILIIGLTWEQLPILEHARRAGHQVIATGVQNPYLEKADKFYTLDSRNLTAIEEIFCSQKPDAIIADECDYSMYAVAYLSDKYGKPGPSLRTLAITNNKYLQRLHAQNAGIQQPSFELSWNFKDSQKAAESIGYPVIVKPLDNRGSIGVGVAANSTELEHAWYLAIANSHSRMCLIEKFIYGDVVTVEGFHDSNQLHLITVSTKEHYAETANVAKVLFYPGVQYPGFPENRILADSRKIAATIGITYGFIHAEFLIEKDTNEVWFVEIANRGGGVHISNRILPAITGLDLVSSLIEMAFGNVVKLEWNGRIQEKSLMYFLNPGGTLSPAHLVQKYGDQILAFFLQPESRFSNVRTHGAAGRKGVILLQGQDHGQMYSLAQKIEAELSPQKDEFYWGKTV